MSVAGGGIAVAFGPMPAAAAAAAAAAEGEAPAPPLLVCAGEAALPGAPPAAVAAAFLDLRSCRCDWLSA